MTIFYFVLAAFALGLLVFVHEWGHYIIAKKTGMTVEVFSIGFGRPVFKWIWGGVTWQIGWLPFGGYVKILGMDLSKHEKREPHEIPHGFFAQAPWKRISVAAAGPIANFILAFLIFCVIWMMGGRAKPFAEYTHIVGWVEPHSELAAMGLRPGDELQSYNGTSFTGSKDLLYAAMLSGKEVTFVGNHVDYFAGTRTPFHYTVAPYPLKGGGTEGLETTGVTATARYLIYAPFPGGENNPLPEGSPMEHSGIREGDRLVWADGELLFSMEQLSAIANRTSAFLTVQRGAQTFMSQQPRVKVNDLKVPSHLHNEWEDWRYAAHLSPRLQDIYTLPYIFNEKGYIEGPLSFIEEKSRLAAFPPHPYSPQLQKPLEAGDRIVAIDGASLNGGAEMLAALQQRRVQFMVQSGVTLDSAVRVDQADALFDASWEGAQIAACAAHAPGVQNYRLLNPVEPLPILQYTHNPEMHAALEDAYQRQLREAEKIRDPARREEVVHHLSSQLQKRLFGISLQDRHVYVNPPPLRQLGSVFGETWQTLRALLIGSLNPKWLSGPVGIVRVIHHGWLVGVKEALFWMGAISVNLGFLNLLPIPVLDGGYICLSLWEWITGRRIKAKTLERLIIPFVVLLVSLLIFLTFQDLLR